MHGRLQEQLPEGLFLDLGQQRDGPGDIIQTLSGASLEEFQFFPEERLLRRLDLAA